MRNFIPRYIQIPSIRCSYRRAEGQSAFFRPHWVGSEWFVGLFQTSHWFCWPFQVSPWVSRPYSGPTLGCAHNREVGLLRPHFKEKENAIETTDTILISNFLRVFLLFLLLLFTFPFLAYLILQVSDFGDQDLSSFCVQESSIVFRIHVNIKKSLSFTLSMHRTVVHPLLPAVVDNNSSPFWGLTLLAFLLFLIYPPFLM